MFSRVSKHLASFSSTAAPFRLILEPSSIHICESDISRMQLLITILSPNWRQFGFENSNFASSASSLQSITVASVICTKVFPVV